MSTIGYIFSVDFQNDYFCQPLSTYVLYYKYLFCNTLSLFNVDYPEICVSDIPDSGVPKEKEAFSGLHFYAL